MSTRVEPSGVPEKHSYGEILKSSALIGGSSVLVIVIGMVRTKVMALILGPAGFGLMGLYGSIVDLALSVAGMGLAGSGVRQIAHAVGTGEADRIGRTVTVLRRLSVGLGVVGALMVAAFAAPISVVTFGSADHALAVALLSIAVLFRVVSAGQGALLQGMRRISDLAIMGVLGALLGAFAGIPLVYLLGVDGVAPAVVATAALGLLMSWWYSRRVAVEIPPMKFSEFRLEAADLMKLGFAFMVSGILMMGAAYTVRAMVVQSIGLDAAGLYQAAWTLGGLYVGIVLQAMGADFYPRLVAASNDHPTCNQLVNEQAQVSMLMAAPGVIATITLAPLVIHLFYAADFIEAVDVLRWICLGIAMRVITWPMGFIIVAKNKQRLFIAVEVVWTAVNIGATWLCLKWFGLSGAGVAFFGSYLVHGIVLYPIVRRLTGFRWSSASLKTGLVFCVFTTIVFCAFQFVSSTVATAIGVAATVASSLYSSCVLARLVPLEQLPGPLQRLLRPFIACASRRLSRSRSRGASGMHGEIQSAP